MSVAFTRIYIWHWPVRAFHWATVASLIMLGASELYIGRPYFVLSPTAATTPYLMAWMRFLHFAAAGVLVGALILRLYALFMGNRYERWRSLIPYTRKDWIDLFRFVKKYLVADWSHPPHYVGHNPLQQWSYTLLMLLLIFMTVTGFALYGQANPGGFWWVAATTWVTPMLGGNQWVRLLHHLGLWAVVVFAVIHVYLAIWSDVLYSRGTVSSIISGYKYRHDRLHYDDV